MSENLRKYADFIKAYPLLHPKARKQVQNTIDKDLLEVVCDICLNIQEKQVVVTKKQKQKLSKFKNLLKYCSSREHPKLKKARKIAQKGGSFFLPLLFSIITPLISSFISK
jgi:malonyl CoA-acyl carrier protein transacylase